MSENILENKKLNVVEKMAPVQRKYLDRLIRELEEIAGGRSKEEIFSSKDLNLINDLIDHFRNLMVCKVSKDLDEIISLPEESIER